MKALERGRFLFFLSLFHSPSSLMTLRGLITYDHSAPLTTFSFPMKKLLYNRKTESAAATDHLFCSSGTAVRVVKVFINISIWNLNCMGFLSSFEVNVLGSMQH